MLHYQLLRNKNSTEWMVFIHGAGGSSNVWYRQVRPFGRTFNLLLIDLRGHGLSAMQNRPEREEGQETVYTFTSLAQDVIEILNHHGLKGCHFMGLSLGTIIIREIVEIDPSYVRSMVLAGAILKLDTKTKILSRAANAIKRCIPYMTLYKFYARLIMPHAAHRKSRLLFISNAMRITHDEFRNWMTLNRNLDQMLSIYHRREPAIPTLYIMGENDYVFLSQIRLLLSHQHEHSLLCIIPGAGHICNIDRSGPFNSAALGFLEDFVLHPAEEVKVL